MSELEKLFIKFQEKPWNFSYNQGFSIINKFNSYNINKNFAIYSNYKLSCNSSDFFINENNQIQINQSALLGRNGVLPLEISNEIIKKKVLLKIIQFLEKKFFLLKHEVAKLDNLSLSSNEVENKNFIFQEIDKNLMHFNFFFKFYKKSKNLEVILSFICKYQVQIQEFVEFKQKVINQHQFKLKENLSCKILGKKITTIKNCIMIKIFFYTLEEFTAFVNDEKVINSMIVASKQYLNNIIYLKFQFIVQLKEKKSFFLKNIKLGNFWLGSIDNVLINKF